MTKFAWVNDARIEQNARGQAVGSARKVIPTLGDAPVGAVLDAALAELLETGIVGTSIIDVMAAPYNAFGDGIADDTVVIQRALDDAGVSATANAQALVIIPRLCKVTPQALIGGGPGGSYCIKVPSYVTVQGRGDNTGFVCATDAATVVLVQGTADAAHNKGAQIRNLSVRSGDSSVNNMGRGIYLMRADYAVVENCDVRGSIIGIQCDVPTADTYRNLAPRIVGNRVHDTYWSGALQTGNGTGIFLAGTTGGLVAHNRMYNIAEHCVYISAETRGVTIAHNDLRPLNASNQNCGVQIYTSVATPNIDGIVIQGNTVVGGKWGILASTTTPYIKRVNVNGNVVSGQTTDGIVFSQCEECSATSNTVSGVTAGDGIRADASRAMLFSGNTSMANGNSGLMFYNTVNSIISDNISLNNDQANSTNYGLRLGATSTGNRIIGNICTDNQVSKTQKYGIQGDAGAIDNYISGNYVLGNVTASMSTFGCMIDNNKGYNPVGPSSIGVTASPMTYTAGQSPETVYVYQGTVSSITKGASTLATQTNQQFLLAPGQAIVITYSVAPFMTKDIQ